MMPNEYICGPVPVHEVRADGSCVCTVRETPIAACLIEFCNLPEEYYQAFLEQGAAQQRALTCTAESLEAFCRWLREQGKELLGDSLLYQATVHIPIGGLSRFWGERNWLMWPQKQSAAQRRAMEQDGACAKTLYGIHQWQSVLLATEMNALCRELLKAPLLDQTYTGACMYLDAMLTGLQQAKQWVDRICQQVEEFPARRRLPAMEELLSNAERIPMLDPKSTSLALGISMKKPIAAGGVACPKTKIRGTDGTWVQQVFACSDLQELLAMEAKALHMSGHRIKRCALCGRYFLACNRNSQYCNQPNPAYHDVSCRDVMRNRSHGMKQARVKNAGLKKEYEKNNRTYARWYRENYKASTSIEVRGELEQIRRMWQQQAKEAMTAYAEGILLEEACRDAIQLPPAKERSFLRWQERKEQRDA